MDKRNIFVLAILLVAGETFSSDDDEDECAEIFAKYTKPRNCCNYPLRHILDTHQEKCKKSCAKLKVDASGCCFLNCNYHNSGVFKDNVFDETALLELYENYLSENGGGKFDQWLPIIEKSIETCKSLISKSDQIFSCNIPDYVLDIMDCVENFNFINCPNYKETSECQELRKFHSNSTKCGKKVKGTFIIDYNFFKVDKK